MEARLSSKKLETAVQAVKLALTKKAISHIDLQSLVGFLSFVSKVVMPGRAFMRWLYDALRENINFHLITADMRQDLISTYLERHQVIGQAPP